MLNYDKFVCACCMYITYNISNYNRHLKTYKHNKNDSLHNMVGNSKKDLLHKCINIEKDSDEIKNDSLHNMVGNSKKDLLHKFRCIKCNYETTICSNYYRHKRTKTHIHRERNNIEKYYECIKCKFKSKYKSNYKRHLLSKKHLRIIDNRIESCNSINFNEFIKLIKSDLKDIETIISVGIEKYVISKLKDICDSIKLKPIYCSDLKRKKFMIYNKNIWHLVNKDILKEITEKFQKNILKKSSKWKKENKFKYSLERLNDKYIYIINICSENLINNKILVKDLCRLFKKN